MCTTACIIFGAQHLSKEEVVGKKVIEVGAYDVNGSMRSIVKSWNPTSYVGVDIEAGPGVDVVCSADDLVEKFGKESFDIVISTEMLEHARDWRQSISNMKNIVKKNGIILITTRSFGFNYHAYPYDFWRYEVEDMKEIFADCSILVLEKDPKEPGVFLKVQKPADFKERNLSDYKLYSIVANKRVVDVSEKDFATWYFKRTLLKDKIKNAVLNFGKSAYSHV